MNEAAEQAYCAHQNVSYRREDFRLSAAEAIELCKTWKDGGIYAPPQEGMMMTRGWWECDSGCGTRFVSVCSAPTEPAPRNQLGISVSPPPVSEWRARLRELVVEFHGTMQSYANARIENAGNRSFDSNNYEKEARTRDASNAAKVALEDAIDASLRSAALAGQPEAQEFSVDDFERALNKYMDARAWCDSLQAFNPEEWQKRSFKSAELRDRLISLYRRRASRTPEEQTP